MNPRPCDFAQTDRGFLRRWMPWILLSGALIGLAFLADTQVNWWLDGPQPKFIRRAARLTSYLGDWPALAIAATIVAGLGYVLRRRCTRIVCLMLVAASIAGLAANVSRCLTGRTRPSSDLSQGWYGPTVGKHHRLARHEANSFPSAHTTAATAFFVTLLILAPNAGFWFIPAPFLIGASRLFLGVHHFSDVCAGLILGVAVALFTCRVLAPYWVNVRAWCLKVLPPGLTEAQISP